MIASRRVKLSWSTSSFFLFAVLALAPSRGASAQAEPPPAAPAAEPAPPPAAPAAEPAPPPAAPAEPASPRDASAPPASCPPCPSVGPVAPDDARTLRGHRFVPFRSVVFPFVVTRVGATTSVGIADVELVVEDVPRVGDRFSRDGTLAFIDSTFAGQLAVAPFLALRLWTGVGVTGGADSIGAIDVGANAGAALGAGVLARLFEGERAYVSLSVDGQILRALGLSPKRLFAGFDVEDGMPVVRSIDVTYDARVLRLDPSLAAAITLSRALGLQMSAGYSLRHVEAITGFAAGTEHSLHGAVGLSLYFGPATFLVGARVVHEFDDEFEGSVISAVEPLDPTRGEAELGGYFTARRNLDLGVVVIGSLSGDDRRLQGLASLAYYF